ncbi:MAG: Hsp20/alpha crystallin family protein [Guyparkeria sp.]|uniref:Hsp20/alpha crystallin family protein n=1 Tax=Guyparkeria sp. TaxID=2035736 RepID=UPI00397CC898
MTALDQLKQGVHRTWSSISDGWSRLTDAAGQALTRFSPGKRESPEEHRDLARRNVGWGLLPVEVFDEGDRLEIRLEAPGLEREDFQVEVDEDRLHVAGEKRVERQHRDGDYHVAECAYGRFARVIPLPAPVKADSARARYHNGVLEISLEKTEDHRRRRIEIRSD